MTPRAKPELAMAHQQPIRNKTTASSQEIPDKLYFRIGEVAKLCEVPAYVLRFWESEFPQLKPNKGGTGQRLYRRRDVEMALRVKTLLYDEGYTIAGARQALKSEPKKAAPELAIEPSSSQAISQADREKLRGLRGEMQDLLGMLSKPAPAKPAGATVQSIRSARGRRAVAELETGSLFAGLLPPQDA
jgi:DNA-binding transcriptional MerR regulator